MGASKRLYTSVDGGGGGIIAPSVDPRDGDFDSGTLTRDVRPNRVQVITLSGFGGADEFVVNGELDGDPLGSTVAFVRGVNATAAAIQAALRTLTGDTSLTVAGTTDTGPFDITHTKATFRRHFPRYTITGTGCTGVVTFKAAPEGDATIGALGESHRVSESDTILKPTIGTITVTPGVDEVTTVSYSAGTDGGVIGYRFDRGPATTDLRWDATLAELQTALAESLGGTDDRPTVVMTGREAYAFDLNDVAPADTFKVTYNAVESALITFAASAAANAAAIQAAINALTTIQAPEDEVLVTPGLSAELFTVTRARPGTAFANTFSITSPTGFTPEGGVGFTDGVGDAPSVAAADVKHEFTFENGRFAGRPVGTKFALSATTALTDGGVAEAPTKVIDAAGALGSISAAYTENGAGDSVLGAAVNDSTGKSYGAQVDAATPLAISSLPPGAYHLVLRTIEDGRVSKADSKAFTVTSA